MKGHHFLPVFLLIVGSYAAFHFYAASWLARGFALPAPSARAARLALLLLALLSPFSMFMKRRFPDPSLDWLFLAGYSWMGIILLAGSAFFLADLLTPLARRWLSPPALQNLRLALLGALALIVAYSFYGGLKNPDFEFVRVRAPGLQKGLAGLRIAQLSDIHADAGFKLRMLEDAVGRINGEKPDLVFVTGDLVDPGLTPEGLARLSEIMRRLNPRLGVFGVLGNHEYYFGYEKAVALYKDCGIRLLRNEGVDAGGFRIIGLSDIATEGLTPQGLEGILAKNRAEGFSLLLTHQPQMCDLVSRAGKYVVFAGHVHRAQLFPFHIFVRLVYRYFYGLYRVGDSFVYVTSGAGTWGPPMRLLAPSEIPLLTLEAAGARRV